MDLTGTGCTYTTGCCNASGRITGTCGGDGGVGDGGSDGRDGGSDVGDGGSDGGDGGSDGGGGDGGGSGVGGGDGGGSGVGGGESDSRENDRNDSMAAVVAAAASAMASQTAADVLLSWRVAGEIGKLSEPLLPAMFLLNRSLVCITSADNVGDELRFRHTMLCSVICDMTGVTLREFDRPSATLYHVVTM